jgi:hypothetical protein
MPESNGMIDIATRWQPVAETFTAMRTEFGALAQCAETVLQEVEGVQRELLNRSLELAQLEARLEEREAELAEQRIEHGKLLSHFEQQEARLADAADEVRRLRGEMATREPSAELAEEAAFPAAAETRSAWESDRNEILERLSALVVMQQTGAGNDAAVSAFCSELTEIRQLLTGNHKVTRELLETGREEWLARWSALEQVAAQSGTQDAAVREAQQQAILDRLAEAMPVAEDHRPLLETILERLAEMRSAVDHWEQSPAAAAAGASPVEPLLEDLRREMAELRAAAEQSLERGPLAVPADGELLGQLRQDIDTLRRQAEEARLHAQREEQERALVEAELDRLRSQAAQWRQQLDEQSVHHHEEERLWREELQELRHLVVQATGHVASAEAARSGKESTAGASQSAQGEAAAGAPDVVANSLMAQFAKLQKDSARRRTRGGNS